MSSVSANVTSFVADSSVLSAKLVEMFQHRHKTIWKQSWLVGGKLGKKNGKQVGWLTEILDQTALPKRMFEWWKSWSNGRTSFQLLVSALLEGGTERTLPFISHRRPWQNIFSLNPDSLGCNDTMRKGVSQQNYIRPAVGLPLRPLSQKRSCKNKAALDNHSDSPLSIVITGIDLHQCDSFIFLKKKL